MTYAEKFKQVFGFYPDVHPGEEICNSVYCDDKPCDKCKYSKSSEKFQNKRITWMDEYV